MGWVGNNGLSQRGQITDHRQSCVSLGVVMFEKPITRSPQFWAFTSHFLSQSPESKISDCQSVQEDRIPGARFLEHRKYEFRIHICPHLSCVFRSGEVGVFHWLEACLVSGSYP